MEQHEERCDKYGERIASLEAHVKNYIGIITRVEAKQDKLIFLMLATISGMIAQFAVFILK